MRYRDFKIVEGKILTESRSTRITVGNKTYEVGNDLIKENGVYEIFSGDGARAYARLNNLIVPPREVLQEVYRQGRRLEMPTRPNNPTDRNAEEHHEQIIEKNGNIPSGLVYGHKKEICEGPGTRLFGGIVNGRQLQAGTRSQHGGSYVDYSQGLRECRLIEGAEQTQNADDPEAQAFAGDQGETYVIGDSHAVAMGGANNLAVNGARLSAIARQARRVEDGSTVYMTGGHNDVAAGSSPQNIANAVKTLINNLKSKGCTVNYVLFPEGTRNPNQENMAPTREAIKNQIEIFHDLEGSQMQRDGIHAVLSAYRGLVGGQGNGGSVTRSDRGEPEDEDLGLRAGPPYPREDREQVRAVQTRLEELGYSVGSTGVDGKYGPRTTEAVRAFKADNNIPGDGLSLSETDLLALASAERVANPTAVNTRDRSRGNSEDIDDLVGDSDLITRARQTAEEFLGREMSDEEFNYLIRASAAEASSNSQERAGVAAVMLNRARENHGGFGRSIIDQLERPGQFQAVSGIRRRGSWTGPSSNFTNMSSRTGEQVMASIVRYLPRMDRTWQNFTSNNPRAYGAGTNINFMYAMRRARDSQVIGQTVFGTV